MELCVKKWEKQRDRVSSIWHFMYLIIQPMPYYVRIARFMPRVEIVQKNNTNIRRLCIQGDNGKVSMPACELACCSGPVHLTVHVPRSIPTLCWMMWPPSMSAGERRECYNCVDYSTTASRRTRYRLHVCITFVCMHIHALVVFCTTIDMAMVLHVHVYDVLIWNPL